MKMAIVLVCFNSNIGPKIIQTHRPIGKTKYNVGGQIL
jgi:hypothetical protein